MSSKAVPRAPYLPDLPPAPTPLGRYRILSPHASVRVSPIQLGAMSVGTAWGAAGMGAMDRESSFKLLDAFYEAGGNFIDTARNYQDGTSEGIIGEWMELRGVRDQMVIATKYSSPWKKNDPSIRQKTQYMGNGAKALHISVEHSLKALRTDYLDILYCHFFDWEIGIEEWMNSLHNLVVSGKVIYLGVSDCPAWIVARANQYAIDHGKTPFCIYQGQWNLSKRAFEKEVIPMAREMGLALAPWDVLGGGRFRTDAEDEAHQKDTGRRLGFTQDGQWQRNETDIKISHALEKVAADVGAKNIQSVAIAYHLHKTPYVFPIIGMRKVENLQKNIDALTISLTQEQIEFLESVVPVDPEFPHWLVGDGTKPCPIIATAVETDFWPKAKAISPAQD